MKTADWSVLPIQPYVCLWLRWNIVYMNAVLSNRICLVQVRVRNQWAATKTFPLTFQELCFIFIRRWWWWYYMYGWRKTPLNHYSFLKMLIDHSVTLLLRSCSHHDAFEANNKGTNKTHSAYFICMDLLMVEINIVYILEAAQWPFVLSIFS